eukprot:1632130-Rhodomonas_salina.1
MPTARAKVRGTYPFMAPEVLCGEGISEASDVWSLAMLFSVLLSGDEPFAAATSQCKNPAQVPFVLKDRLEQGERPALGGLAAQGLQTLVTSMWAQDPERRPRAAEVRDRLLAARQGGERRMAEELARAKEELRRRER